VKQQTTLSIKNISNGNGSSNPATNGANMQNDLAMILQKANKEDLISGGKS
jgi:hypothetical protein